MQLIDSKTMLALFLSVFPTLVLVPKLLQFMVAAFSLHTCFCGHYQAEQFGTHEQIDVRPGDF